MGTQVQRALAALLGDRGLLDDPLHVHRAVARARDEIDDPLAATPRAQHLARAMASVYLQLFLPPTDWALLGEDVGYGRSSLDLVWRDPHGMTLFDELKCTTGWQRPDFGDADRKQVLRHVRHGNDRPGHAFLGVRYLTLARPWSSRWVRPDLTDVPIAAAPWVRHGTWTLDEPRDRP